MLPLVYRLYPLFPLPGAAILLTLAKDSVGHMSGILFAWLVSTRIDSECKSYRFAAGIHHLLTFNKTGSTTLPLLSTLWYLLCFYPFLLKIVSSVSYEGD